jgi:hypothetical protein
MTNRHMIKSPVSRFFFVTGGGTGNLAILAMGQTRFRIDMKRNGDSVDLTDMKLLISLLVGYSGCCELWRASDDIGQPGFTTYHVIVLSLAQRD